MNRIKDICNTIRIAMEKIIGGPHGRAVIYAVMAVMFAYYMGIFLTYAVGTISKGTMTILLLPMAGIVVILNIIYRM